MKAAVFSEEREKWAIIEKGNVVGWVDLVKYATMFKTREEAEEMEDKMDEMITVVVMPS